MCTHLCRRVRVSSGREWLCQLAVAEHRTRCHVGIVVGTLLGGEEKLSQNESWSASCRTGIGARGKHGESEIDQ